MGNPENCSGNGQPRTTEYMEREPQSKPTMGDGGREREAGGRQWTCATKQLPPRLRGCACHQSPHGLATHAKRLFHNPSKGEDNACHFRLSS